MRDGTRVSVRYASVGPGRRLGDVGLRCRLLPYSRVGGDPGLVSELRWMVSQTLGWPAKGCTCARPRACIRNSVHARVGAHVQDYLGFEYVQWVLNWVWDTNLWLEWMSEYVNFLLGRSPRALLYRTDRFVLNLVVYSKFQSAYQ